jgi:hypothetical protein
MNSSGYGIFLGIVAAVCWSAAASSATIKSFTGKRGGIIIEIAGQITAGDADAFLGEIKQANAAGKLVENVQLNSTGGKLIEAAKLAAAIREGKIPTIVGQGAVCASACFLAFAAGDPKFAGDGARIGVHKASDKGGRETVMSGVATVSMARFAKELGVPSPIIGRMMTTPAGQIVWLTSQDLRSMGVKPMQPGELASAPASQATASTSPLSWNEFIDMVSKLSAEQNNGNAALSRLCQPEFNNCILGLAYLLKDGRQGLAVVVQDVHGKTMRREVCEFNNSKDERSCIDWDSGAKHNDAKNANGDWVQVAGE